MQAAQIRLGDNHAFLGRLADPPKPKAVPVTVRPWPLTKTTNDISIP
jgi:hypothetical protein